MPASTPGGYIHCWSQDSAARRKALSAFDVGQARGGPCNLESGTFVLDQLLANPWPFSRPEKAIHTRHHHKRFLMYLRRTTAQDCCVPVSSPSFNSSASEGGPGNKVPRQADQSSSSFLTRRHPQETAMRGGGYQIPRALPHSARQPPVGGGTRAMPDVRVPSYCLEQSCFLSICLLSLLWWIGLRSPCCHLPRPETRQTPTIHTDGRCFMAREGKCASTAPTD